MALQSLDVVVFVLWKDLCTSHSQQGRGCLVVQPLMNARQHTGGVLAWCDVAAKTGSDVTSEGLLNVCRRVWTEHRWSSCQFHSMSITDKWTLRQMPVFHHWQSHVQGHPAVSSVVWYLAGRCFSNPTQLTDGVAPSKCVKRWKSFWESLVNVFAVRSWNPPAVTMSQFSAMSTLLYAWSANFPNPVCFQGDQWIASSRQATGHPSSRFSDV